MRKHTTIEDEIAGMTFEVVRRDGRWMHLWIDGTLLPIVRGGSDAGPADPPPADPPPADLPADPPPADPPAEGKLTQAEVDRQIQDRLAREQAKLAKDLGMTPAEAKKILDAHNKKLDEDKDEKTKREAAEAKTVAAEQKAQVIERDASIRIAVADTDVDKAARPRVALLVAAELGDELEPTEADITAAIDAVKKDMPTLFAAKKTASGDHSGGPRGGNGPATGMDAGRERAKAEKERESKEPDFLSGLQPLGANRASA